MSMVHGRGTSYLQWAACISASTGKQVSRQALHRRMGGSWLALVKKILSESISKAAARGVDGRPFQGFGRVLLQDSTAISLPAVMKRRFKGNVSGGKQKAVAKVNVVMDLLGGTCPVLKLVPFARNEQALAGSILQVARKGDLVIRDLGYFVLPVLARMQKKGVYFLSRLKSQVHLYEPGSGKKIDLAKLLKKKGQADMDVLCGKKGQLKVRLVAVKLGAKQAAERRRKARADRDRRLNHGKEYYALLGYAIFITTVGRDIWCGKQVADAYRVRWNIEILFKAWKGNLGMERMVPADTVHKERIESFLYLMLLYIAWFHVLVYMPLQYEAHRQGRQLSMLKLTSYILTALANWLTEPLGYTEGKRILTLCCYDKRKRTNAIADLQLLYDPLG